MGITTVSVPANLQGWTDSGLVLTAGQAMNVTASGYVTFGVSSPPVTAFPEGSYGDTATNHAYQPWAIRTTSYPPDPPLCTNAERAFLKQEVMPLAICKSLHSIDGAASVPSSEREFFARIVDSFFETDKNIGKMFMARSHVGTGFFVCLHANAQTRRPDFH